VRPEKTRNEPVVRVYDPAQANITIPRWPTATEDRASPSFDMRNKPRNTEKLHPNV